MQASTQDGQTTNKTRSRRDLLQTVLLVVVVIALSAGAGFFAGFQAGKKAGVEQAIKKVTDFINPLNGLSNNPLFPSTVIGKVNAVDDRSISITLPNGDKKNIVTTKDTRVTKGEQTLGIGDVKKDADVTVLTTGKDKDQTATRIVLR